MKPVKYPANKIKRDPRLQMRESINPDIVHGYSEIYKESPDTFPPLDTFVINGERYLVDGWHRLEAFLSVNREGDIQIHERSGNMSDAIVFAAGANRSHGLYRTPGDKRRSVESILAIDEWRMKPARAVAEAAGVTEQYVRAIKSDNNRDEVIDAVVARVHADVMSSIIDEADDDEPEFELPPIGNPLARSNDNLDDEGQEVELVLKAMFDQWSAIRRGAGLLTTLVARARAANFESPWIDKMYEDAKAIEATGTKNRETLRSELQL
jgi:hypothetical protein